MRRILILALFWILGGDLLAIGNITSNNCEGVKPFGVLEGVVFAGKYEKENLYFSTFNIDSKGLGELSHVTFVNSKGKSIPIEKVFVSNSGLVVIGRLKSKTGFFYYVGEILNDGSGKLEGQVFHSVTTNKEEPISEISCNLSELKESVCLSYLKKNKRSGEFNLIVSSTNFSGSIVYNQKIDLKSDKDTKITDLNIQPFSVGHKNLVVGYTNMTDEFASMILAVNLESGRINNQELSNDQYEMNNFHLSLGPDNTFLVTAFEKSSDSKDGIYNQVVVKQYQVESLELMFQVDFKVDKIQVFTNKWLSVEKQGEGVFNDDFRIKNVDFTTGDFIAIYANRYYEEAFSNGQIKTSKDQLFFKMDRSGESYKSLLIQHDFIAEENDLKMNSIQLESEYMEESFCNSNMFSVLLKRPNFDRMLDTPKSTDYVPLELNVNILDWFIEGDVEPNFGSELHFSCEYLKGVLRLSSLR